MHAPALSSQNIPRAGTNATVTSGPGGFTVGFGQSKKWLHPWQTRLWWLGDLKQWVATVHPGFVNGRAPIVRTRTAVARSLSGRFYNGLITARSGAADIARAAVLASETGGAAGTSSLDVKLYNNPPVMLGFRPIGFDGQGAAVPAFFKRLGVTESPVPATDGFTNAEAVAAALEQTPPKGNRLLRAADIVLHQPRMALTSSFAFGPGALTGLSNASQTLGLRFATPGDALKVYASAQWNPPASTFDPLSGDYEEQSWDELRIATVYLLSPPDTAPGTEPDERWVPYVQHNLFWNLTYLAKTALDVPQIDSAVGQIAALGSVLAGGIASLSIAYLSASINDLTQNALNLLAAHSMAGTWWTATGGGSTSESPQEAAPAAPASGNGWDKSARLQAQRIATARALKAMRLDPPFPFRAVSFTPSLLNQ